MWNDFVEVFQAGLLTSCLFLLAVVLVACAVVAVGPFIRDQWRRFRGRDIAAKAVAIIAAIVAVAYGGSKSHDVQNAGADDGISLAGITAAYDSTNELTAVEVRFTGGGVTTATPVSVRNAETEQWRELAKIGATITSDLPTNILAFATAVNATTNRFWWVGTDTPPVVVTTEGITITNFVASSHSVHIAWTCDDPKATEFAIQRRRVKPASIPYDAEIEYLESTGTQWIDTGILPNGGTDFELCMFTRRDVNQNAFGSRNVASGPPAWGLIAHGTGTWSIDRLGSTWNQQFPRDVGAVHTYAFQNGVALYDGEPKGIISGNVQVNYPALLFAYNAGGNVYPQAVQCVLGCKIWQDGVLVRDLQPVRVGGGASAVGYMYDRVTNRLLGNSGSGAFNIGGDTLSYDWETVATTEGGSFDYIGFTVGESWEWRITSTYTEGE